MNLEDKEHSGKRFFRNVAIREGIDSDLARRLVKIIKEEKLKVQTSIQGDQVRVSGKKRDDLQKAIALIKEADLTTPLQFKNFRDFLVATCLIVLPPFSACAFRALRQDGSAIVPSEEKSTAQLAFVEFDTVAVTHAALTPSLDAITAALDSAPAEGAVAGAVPGSAAIVEELKASAAPLFHRLCLLTHFSMCQDKVTPQV